ncbi:hypothetical protein N0V90_009145 [Kalmusia sp. IMI 367209]|nr:hypothetical protein N0V90_009145 [Kalmusia sp. IMI 367209]
MAEDEPGNPPFQWRGKVLRNPPEILHPHNASNTSTALEDKGQTKPSPRDYDSTKWHDVRAIAKHWINKRYTTKTSTKRPTAQPTQWIDYEFIPMNHPDGRKAYHVKVKYNPHKDKFYLLQRDNQWVKEVESRPDGFDSKPSWKITLYFDPESLDDSLYAIEGDAKTNVKSGQPAPFFYVKLWTSFEAYGLFQRIWICEHQGEHDHDHDMLPILQPEGRLDHWASVTRTHRLNSEQKQHKYILPQFYRIEACADLDYSYSGHLEMSFDEPLLGRHVPCRQQVIVGQQSHKDGLVERYELFVTFDTAEGNVSEEPKIYIYDVSETTWFLVFESQKSVVSHARANIAMAESRDGQQAQAQQRWNLVIPPFKSSLNSVFMFVKTDQYMTVLDRMIVKPLRRHHREFKNDDNGESIAPKEYEMNRRVSRMDASNDLEYEDGGTLDELLERHRKRADEGDGPSYLPEIFIWIVFERLVRACECLQYDGSMRDKYASNGFINHDIKCMNILLKPREREDDKKLRQLLKDRARREKKNKEISVREAAENRTPTPKKKSVRASSTVLSEAATRRIAENDTVVEMNDGTELRLVGNIVANQSSEEEAELSDEAARAYPIPILADLEFCYRLTHERVTGLRGTLGFRAPGMFPTHRYYLHIYQVRYADRINGVAEQHDEVQVMNRVDIFQIGCVIYSLMRGLRAGLVFYKDLTGYDARKAMRYWDSISQYDNMYSSRLSNLVGACLKQEINKRPDIKSLLVSVQAGLNQHDELIGGVRDKNANKVHDWYKVPKHDEQFLLGATFAGQKKRSDHSRSRTWGNPYSADELSEFEHHVQTESMREDGKL